MTREEQREAKRLGITVRQLHELRGLVLAAELTAILRNPEPFLRTLDYWTGEWQRMTDRVLGDAHVDGGQG